MSTPRNGNGNGNSSGNGDGDGDGSLKAFVQTAEHTGGFVWVITLVDFAAREVRRSLVSEDVWANRAAAKDAGEARLAAMAADR